jgi:single-strand DNA-binding protein
VSLYNYDQTIIVGKAGGDAEMRFTPSGVAVTSFSVAVDRSHKKDGEKVKLTIWYKVSVWGNFAEVVSNIKKGERVLVEGQLEPDPKTGGPKVYAKKDGTSGASFEIKAREVRFLSDKSTVEVAQELGGEPLPF